MLFNGWISGPPGNNALDVDELVVWALHGPGRGPWSAVGYSLISHPLLAIGLSLCTTNAHLKATSTPPCFTLLSSIFHDRVLLRAGSYQRRNGVKSNFCNSGKRELLGAAGSCNYEINLLVELPTISTSFYLPFMPRRVFYT
jgi:hypothetical protein